MKAINHTGFNCTMKHEARAVRDGKIRHNKEVYNKIANAWTIHTRPSQVDNQCELYKYKKYAGNDDMCVTT